MNGVALIVALALPGVEYSLETTADGQQLYTIQVPAEVLPLVQDGQEIHSEVPLEAGTVHRLCIRIGKPVQHNAAAQQQFRQLLASAGRVASATRSVAAVDGPPTILWPAAARPEQTYHVATGWQPDASGHQQYFVQIDPTMFRTLAPGDEVHVPVDPAAGRAARFVVKTGKGESLPRIAAPPGQPALPPSSTAVASNRYSNPAAPTTLPPVHSPAGGGSRFGDIGPLPPMSPAMPPSTTHGGAADYGRNSPVGGFAGSGAASSRYNLPVPEVPADPRSSAFNSGLGHQGPSRDLPLLEAPRNASDPRQSYGAAGGYLDQRAALDQRGAVDPRSTAAGDHRGFGSSPATGYIPPAATPPDLAQFPSRSSGYAAGQPDYRVAAANSNPTMPPPPVASLSPPTGTGTAPPSADKPSTPFFLAMIALFFSIGGNLYLAWTALEFHTRYRNAIERLRSAARST